MQILTASLFVLLAALSAVAFPDNLIPDLPTVVQKLTLKEALALAAANNLLLKQSGADTAVAHDEARATSAQTKLSISTTTYGLIGDSNNIVTSSPGVMPPNYFGTPTGGVLDQNVIAMVPISTGGRLAGQVSAAQAQSRAAAFTLDQTKLAVQEAVIDAYGKALLQTALIDVSQERLTAENEQVRITQERVQTGRSAPVDLLREQAEQANAQQALLTAQNDAAIAGVELKTVLGISQASDIMPADTLGSITISAAFPTSLQDALQIAEMHRPDLAAAFQQATALRASVQAAKGAYSPQLYALGMADASSISRGGGRVGYTIGLTASLPLYDGGQRRAEVDAAKARLDRAISDAQRVRQAVDQDVASAWLNLQVAMQQVQTAQTGVNAAQQAYELANLRYNAGKSVAAERLDALAALTRARGDLSTATAAVIETKAHLLVAMGSSL